ncbi:Prefoldin subunit 2 [Coelomomyces lativittatus]|nr:Prefoldin subunit 2 [Coelomomyces lativittatus]
MTSTALSSQEILTQYRVMKQDLQAMASKLAELELDKEEHTMVLETLKPLPSTRKCFRLVGGVLMERTVKEVMPALSNNVEGINNLMQQLAQSLQSKEKETQTFFKTHQSVLSGSEPMA